MKRINKMFDMLFLVLKFWLKLCYKKTPSRTHSRMIWFFFVRIRISVRDFNFFRTYRIFSCNYFGFRAVSSRSLQNFVFFLFQIFQPIIIFIGKNLEVRQIVQDSHNNNTDQGWWIVHFQDLGLHQTFHFLFGHYLQQL